MRRVLVLLLSTGMLGAGVAAADAKPASKAPRLHAFRSCTNLLGYAQRNALRVIRESAVRFPPTPVPTPIQDGAGLSVGVHVLSSDASDGSYAISKLRDKKNQDH